MTSRPIRTWLVGVACVVVGAVVGYAIGWDDGNRAGSASCIILEPGDE